MPTNPDLVRVVMEAMAKIPPRSLADFYLSRQAQFHWFGPKRRRRYALRTWPEIVAPRYDPRDPARLP